MATNLDKDMERVYRLVPVIGHKRAIEQVAGECYDAASDSFVPNVSLRAQLRERYDAEMDEFIENGGY